MVSTLFVVDARFRPTRAFNANPQLRSIGATLDESSPGTDNIRSGAASGRPSFFG